MLCDGDTHLLVANPLKRHVIASSMLDSLQDGEDGSLTIYIQQNAPGKGHAAQSPGAQEFLEGGRVAWRGKDQRSSWWPRLWVWLLRWRSAGRASPWKEAWCQTSTGSMRMGAKRSSTLPLDQAW